MKELSSISNALPLVSIRLMTYNQEKYIKKALQGIFDQEFDFQVEIVVGDDFSDDRTLEIIKSFSSTDTVTLKILKRDKGDSYDLKRQRLGRIYNFVNILENCIGKYVALLDGDDYWIDNEKLKKQIDFLEKNPQYALASSNAIHVNEDNALINGKVVEHPERSFSSKDIINSNFLTTASIVFRRETLIIPEYIYKSPAADWVITSFVLRNSMGYHFQQPFVAYRIHEGGIWSMLNSDKTIDGIRKIAQNHLGNYHTHMHMSKDDRLPVAIRKESKKRKASYAYQYNRLLLKNPELKSALNPVPNTIFLNGIKLILVRLKLI